MGSHPKSTSNLCMIISHSRKFVFVHVYKTAGESIAATLEQSLDRSDFVSRVDSRAWLGRRNANNSYDQLKKHSTALAVREVMESDEWNTYFKFSFVRHPIDRILSLYHYLSGILRDRESSIARRVFYRTPLGRDVDPRNSPGARAYLDSASFSDFIRHPILNETRARDPNANFVRDLDGALMLDFVGRFELLGDDLQEVQRRIGLPCQPLISKNSSKRSPFDLDAVSSDDRAYLGAKYRDDFKLFGYDD